jgi:uncharacterized protein YndB with AHSA1/START domain
MIAGQASPGATGRPAPRERSEAGEGQAAVAEGIRTQRGMSDAAADAFGERWVELDRRLDAQPDRVYRAFADPEELPRWLPYAVDGSLAVGTRSILSWPDHREWWELVEATPNRRLVVRHPSSLDDALTTTATITLQPLGLGTRLALRDGPFVLAGATALDAWSVAIQAWTEAVTLLRAYLDFSIDLRPRR